jgi:DnaA family protein
MRQLVLTLAPPPAPALDNFFPGRNFEAVYLWGEGGCGRSHLLQATVALLQARGVTIAYVAQGGRLPAADSDIQALAVDDVDKLDPQAQVAFFNLYNLLRERRGMVLAAGASPPARLQLRPDLLTRLGWGLVYQVHALSDEEKAAALKRHAGARAFDLPDDVVEYLLRHLSRDLPSLMTMLDALDRHSLEVKRPITLPLLRELLQSESGGD